MGNRCCPGSMRPQVLRARPCLADVWPPLPPPASVFVAGALGGRLQGWASSGCVLAETRLPGSEHSGVTFSPSFGFDRGKEAGSGPARAFPLSLRASSSRVEVQMCNVCTHP